MTTGKKGQKISFSKDKNNLFNAPHDQSARGIEIFVHYKKQKIGYLRTGR
jgi:hypothetical protein